MNSICLFINQTIWRKQSKVGMFGMRMEGAGGIQRTPSKNTHERIMCKH